MNFRLGGCTGMTLGEEEAKTIATQFLGQYYNVVRIDAALGGGMAGRQQWKLVVHTTQKIIEVLVDAEDGKILGYTAKI